MEVLDMGKKFILMVIFAVFLMHSPQSYIAWAADPAPVADNESHQIKVQPVPPGKKTIIRRAPAAKIRVGEAKPIEPLNRVEVQQIETQPIAPEPIAVETRKIRPVERVKEQPLPLHLTPEELNGYIQTLRYGQTFSDKANAAKVLGGRAVREYISAGSPVIDEIYDGLTAAFRENSDEETLVNIATSLGGLRKYEAGNLLVYYLGNSTNNNVKSAIILSLGRLQYKEAVNNLMQILQYNSEPMLKAQAAEALGMIGDKSTSYALLSALNDQDNKTKRNAIAALGMIGSADAKYPLLNILNQEGDLAVREEAARALQNIEARERR
jgi:hypothetical protein